MTAGTKGPSNRSQTKETPKVEETEQEEPLADWEVQVAEEEVSDTAKESKEETADDSGGTKEESSEVRVQKNQSTQNRQNDQAGPGNRKRRRRGGRDHGSDEAWDGEPVSVEGYVDLRDEGYGFLRTNGFKPSKTDAYISVKQVRQLRLTQR